MIAAALANVVALGVASPATEPTLIRLEVAAESAVTHVSSAWLWNSYGDAVLTNDGDAHSRGAVGRMLLGRAPVYVGLELGLSRVTSAPALQTGYAATYRTTMPPSNVRESTGTSVTIAAPIGVQSRLGPIILGVEGLVGWRRMSLDSYDGGPTVDGFVPLVETRVRGGVWITPNVSVTLVAGKGVVVNDSASLCLALSLSKVPFDGEW